MDKLSVGCHVIYTDENFIDHDALVTAIWGEPDGKPCVNLLYASLDKNRQDQYGRQIERPTSVVHMQDNQARGYCWRFPGEERLPMGKLTR